MKNVQVYMYYMSLCITLYIYTRILCRIYTEIMVTYTHINTLTNELNKYRAEPTQFFHSIQVNKLSG